MNDERIICLIKGKCPYTPLRLKKTYLDVFFLRLSQISFFIFNLAHSVKHARFFLVASKDSHLQQLQTVVLAAAVQPGGDSGDQS